MRKITNVLKQRIDIGGITYIHVIVCLKGIVSKIIVYFQPTQVMLRKRYVMAARSHFLAL